MCVAIACVSLVTGCSGPKPRNILLIVIDTLRADHLGSYGAERNTSPAIDALAAEGVLFERAYATAPWTKPSIASVMTGLYPRAHGVQDGVERVLPDALLTLAEILHGHDYATGGVISHALIGSKYGFAQGFEKYDEAEARGHDHVSTMGVTRRAIDMLRAFTDGDRPFFLFVHYFDPHYTYMPHAEYDFASASAGRLRGGEDISWLRKLKDWAPEELELIRDLYDEEIRFTDRGIGRLLEVLGELGLDDSTLVVLTADHGEEFLERRWLGHGVSLYDELVRVPLLMRFPDASPERSIIPHPVSLVALPATILDFAGLDASQYGFQSGSLMSLFQSASVENSASVFFEVERFAADKQGIVDGRYKIIRTRKRRFEIYDLFADAKETINLAPQRRDLLDELRPKLEEAITSAHRNAPPAQEEPLTEEEIERLQALGYLTR